MSDGSTPLAVALQGRTGAVFGLVAEPPPVKKELDTAHRAVVEYLRAQGAKE